MVCLGNICRSPLAEGILKNKLDNSKYFVDSAGTANWHEGKLPDHRSIEIASKKGIDITNQRSKPIKSSDLDTFDFIYAMDKSNYANIIDLAKNSNQKNKVNLILSNNNEVPDPYYGGEKGFENVFDMLNEACDRIVKELTVEK